MRVLHDRHPERLTRIFPVPDLAGACFDIIATVKKMVSSGRRIVSSCCIHETIGSAGTPWGVEPDENPCKIRVLTPISGGRVRNLVRCGRKALKGPIRPQFGLFL